MRSRFPVAPISAPPARRGFGRVALAALAAAVFAGSAAAQTPVIISLTGTPRGLNHDGSVVVGSTFNARAARWNIGAALTLTELVGGDSVVRVSDNGLIAFGGVANTGEPFPFPPTATYAARNVNGLWTPTAFAEAASNCSGTVSTPYDMGGDGRFVGGLAYVGGCSGYGFVADTMNGTIDILPRLNPPGNLGGARASTISDDGTVAAGFDQLANRVPAVWVKVDGVWTQQILTNASGVASVGEVFEMTASGQVLVGYVDNGAANVLMTWTRSGNTYLPVELGLMPAASRPAWVGASLPSQARGFDISDDGARIVGEMTYGTGFGALRGAFFWTAATGFVDLRTHLQAANAVGYANYATCGFTTPFAISGDGTTIIGTSTGIGCAGPWYVKLNGTGATTCFQPALATNPTPAVTLTRCNSLIFNAQAGGSGPFTFQWRKDGVPLANGLTPQGSTVSGATTSQMRITSNRLGDAGTYDCVIANACGTVTSAASVLTPDSAGAPANDTCAGATSVSEGDHTFELCNAWTNEGSSTCGGTGPDVFFRYTPSFTGEARFSTCLPSISPDTVLTLFTDCGGTQIACNNDSPAGAPGCSSTQRAFIARTNVVAGVPIVVRLSAFGTTSTGSGTLSISQAPPPAANDTCQTAIPAALGTNLFDTTEATAGGTATCATGSSASRDVWFSFTPTSSGQLTVDTCFGAAFNTVLTAYASCGGPQIACNDTDPISVSSGCPTQATIRGLQVVANQTYFFRLSGNNATTRGSGDFVISLTPQCSVADIVSIGGFPPADGELTVDDYTSFINAFAADELLADIVSIGGFPPADAQLTVDDYTSFINSFAEGCPG